MSLAAGVRLGPYEVVAPLGAGGMGEVYRAKDGRLNRTVAIKVLPTESASDADRRERFEREAKAISALDHPNICALYDVGEHEGTYFLVMPCLEGQTLADRLAKGALPVDQAIKVAVEMATALDAAHRHGIIHRDLKPGNVMLTKTGVKLLDFGLAKLKKVEGPLGETTLAKGTGVGTLLGTMPYMSPEQIEGRDVDARSDIFSFGAVLYEMITGQRAFKGDTAASVIGAILKDHPAPMRAVAPATPSGLEPLVASCLAKDPEQRWRSAFDVALHLTTTVQTASGPQRSGGPSAWRERLAWILAAALAIAAATLLWRDRATGAPARVVTYTLDDKADLSSLSLQPVGLVVSPDGTRIFSQTPANERQLFVRHLDQPAATLLPNTEFGRVLFISPDGTWLGFTTVTALKRISLVDGSVVSICQTETIPSTAAVSAGGDIVFSMGQGLWIVPAAGGTPRPLTVLAPTEQAQAVSGFLPDGRTLLFTNWLPDRSRIETLDIANGTRHVLLDQASGGQYVSTGHLLFARDGALLAAPLDLTNRSTGAAVRVLDRIQTGMFGVPKLGLSRDGSVLAYAEPLRAALVWVSRTGLETPLDLPPRQYQFVAVSGDGRRVAFAEESSVSVADLSRSGSARVSSERFVFGSPAWSPDDSQLAYSVLNGLVTRAVERTEPSRRFGEHIPGWKLSPSWSPDGKTIAYTAYFRETNGDIYVEPVDGSTPPRPFVATNAYDAGLQFSPDSRFVAYASAETGRLEVYVTPFPGPGPKYPVSTNGGTHVRWSRDGRELFYRNGDEFIAVPVSTRPTFTAGRPVLLFRGRYSYGAGMGLPTYDVAPDGRFLMIKNEDDASERPRLIINWADTLQRIVAGR